MLWQRERCLFLRGIEHQQTTTQTFAMFFSYSGTLRSVTCRVKAAGFYEYSNEILDFVKQCKYLTGSATSWSSKRTLRQEYRPSACNFSPIMLPQCLIKRQVMKASSTYSLSRNYMYVNGFTSRVLSSWRKGPPSTNWMLSGPQSLSGRFGEEKISCPSREWTHDPSVVQPVF
jgi:hypothetical protein